ncbi:DnaJ sub B member 6 [Cadophora gregata f. sp. sojae]|nr:DnaJ sub B member 6 [Cadophora gregata f. sp. sojae]
MTQNHYHILGLNMSAGAEEIKRQYRILALAFHPDKNIQDIETATAKFKEVQNSYKVLSDPKKRLAYDATLRDGSDYQPTFSAKKPAKKHAKRPQYAARCDDHQDSDREWDWDFEFAEQDIQRQREILRKQGYNNTLIEVMLQDRIKFFNTRATECREWNRDHTTKTDGHTPEESWDDRDTPRAKVRSTARREKKSSASGAKGENTVKEKFKACGTAGVIPDITIEDGDELSEEEIIMLLKDQLTPERTADSPLSKKEARALKRKEQVKTEGQVKGSTNDNDQVSSADIKTGQPKKSNIATENATKFDTSDYTTGQKVPPTQSKDDVPPKIPTKKVTKTEEDFLPPIPSNLKSRIQDSVQEMFVKETKKWRGVVEVEQIVQPSVPEELLSALKMFKGSFRRNLVSGM